jgi:thiol:disulfide interchange protein
MKSAETIDRRAERGRELEGYAFTFCKAAFLALLFSKYALLVTALAAVVLYVAAAAHGVREWRCFVKPPWVVAFFAAVVALQAYFLFGHVPEVIL